MKQRLLIHKVLWTAAMVFAGLSSTNAAEFPQPKVEYSADLTMKIKTPGSAEAYTIPGKVYSTINKERREVSTRGHVTAVIKDKSTGETLTLMIAQKMYMKNQGPKAHKDPETKIRDGELNITKVGSEKINGRNAVKYKLESTPKSKTVFNGYAWFTKQNIPLRFQGTTVENGQRNEMEIIYSRIVIAKQAPELFTVPKGYRQLPTGMGARGHGMTPEQIEQLKEMYKRQNQ